MTKMLTSCGKPIEELGYNDLKLELRAQKALYRTIQSKRSAEEFKAERNRQQLEEGGDGKSRFRMQLAERKADLFNVYISNLEVMMRDIEYLLERRAEPVENFRKDSNRTKKDIRAENALKRTRVIRENSARYNMLKASERDGMLIAWDRDKFFQVARDNGYQTEESVIWAVADELHLDRIRAEALLKAGRFTWGQVLCLGALMEMTPKEFCDIFLAGYFVDKYGEYVADYENLCKNELLKRAIKPKNILDDMVEVEVGADGKPSDEEVWFDE